MSANRKTEWSVGAFIAMGFACALALAFASTNSRSGVSGETYRSPHVLPTRELKVRAPVKIAGVKVGEVAEVRLDPARFDAIATLRISRNAGDIPADTSAAIYTSGLLGDRYIGLMPGGDPEPLHDGDEILLTQSAVVLEQLIGKYMFGNADGDGGSSSADTNDPKQ